MSGLAKSIKPVFESRVITLRDGREVLLRAGGPGDAAALLAYMHRCLPDFSPYVAMEPGEFKMTEQQERDWLAGQADGLGSLTILAWAQEKIVAILNCSCRSDRLRLSIVGDLGISSDKAYWGSGLGTAMMSALIDWAERNPALELLELDVMADNNRAIALYRSAGFVDVGVVPGRGAYSDGIRKDNLFMYRRLDGILSKEPGQDHFHEDLGGGVVLRQVCYGDAERLWPLYERNRERLRPWFRWAPSVRSVGELRGAIAGWLERYHGEGKVTCLYESAGGVLGMAYLTHVDRDNRRTELGYWLDADQEGRGLVTGGCRSLIRYAFEKLNLNRIDITADVNNKRSRAVAERLGFTQEAVIRQWLEFPDDRLVDVANYRLLREDWHPEGGASP